MTKRPRKPRTPSTAMSRWNATPEGPGVRLKITKEAHDAIRAHADNGFDSSTSEFLEDGRVRILVSHETFARLAGHALKGETPSDCIVRVCTLAASGGRFQ